MTAAATAEPPKTGKEGIKCYNCGQRGHVMTRRPSNATMFGNNVASEFGTTIHQVSRGGMHPRNICA